MADEIERKFLVITKRWRASEEGILIRQGYLCLDKNRTVRIRTAGTKGFLTIKGPTRGITRSEFEYEIPLNDANQLIQMCVGEVIEKRRYRVLHDSSLWEVDEFQGVNQGLVVAEIELTHEDQEIQTPLWVGREVSNDIRYFNSRLAIHPYTQW